MIIINILQFGLLLIKITLLISKFIIIFFLWYGDDIIKPVTTVNYKFSY
jgi:hypothetical protein